MTSVFMDVSLAARSSMVARHAAESPGARLPDFVSTMKNYDRTVNAATA
jgi:hypothetical protein